MNYIKLRHLWVTTVSLRKKTISAEPVKQLKPRECPISQEDWSCAAIPFSQRLTRKDKRASFADLYLCWDNPRCTNLPSGHRVRCVEDNDGQAWQPVRRHIRSAEETRAAIYFILLQPKAPNPVKWTPKNTKSLCIDFSETESSRELGGNPGKGVWKREYSTVREFPGISTNFLELAVWRVIPLVSPECKIWQ